MQIFLFLSQKARVSQNLSVYLHPLPYQETLQSLKCDSVKSYTLSVDGLLSGRLEGSSRVKFILV